MLIDLVRCIKHVKTVRRFAWNIIYCMDKDNIIILRIIVILNDPVIELLDQFIVSQTAGSKTHKKFLGSSICFLIRWKFHVQQVFAKGTGQGFLENLKIFEHFFLRKGEEGFF